MFRKVIFSLLAVLSLTANLKAEWQWANKAGGSGNAETGGGIAVDSQGNQYITGNLGDYTTTKTAVFGGTTLTSNGKTDIFVAKLSPAGTYLWAKGFGGIELDGGAAIAVDSEGNVIVTGSFRGAADFGATTLTSGNNDGYTDVFVAKINPADGNVIWAVKGGGAFNDYSTAITTDFGNNIYVTGGIYGDAVFGALNISAVSDDGFIARIKSNGTYEWVKKLSGSDVQPTGISLGSGGLYVSGHYKGSISCVEPTISSVGSEHDIFCVRTDIYGTFYWSKSFGSTDDNYSFASTADKDGNYIITGTLSTNTNFDSYELIPAGDVDVFVVKLGNSGGVIGARRFGGTNTEYCNSIKSDTDNNLYLTGRFFVNCYFDDITLTNSGSFSDMYIAKINSSGTFTMAEKIGGISMESSNSLALNGDRDIFITGGFSGTVPFGNYTLNGNGNDIFTAKFQQAGSGVEQNNSAETLTLAQNYPNPFNPTTTINFALPYNSKVQLSVYNAKGELVKELVNSQLKVGSHSVTFNGSGLNSGMYFYKLNTGEKSLTKKMLMIK